MKTVGIFLLLLLVGLSTGHLTKCYKCHARNSEYCKGKEIECPEGSVCMTVSEQFECNQTFLSLQRRCSNNLPCDTYMYAYANGRAFFGLSRQCCKGDLCNNGTFSLPNKTYDNDGPECPCCASFDTLERCKPDGTTVCRSATDRCAYLVGWMKKPDGVTTKFSVQGCMSELACKHDYSEAVGFFLAKVVKQGCWSPKSGNYTSVEEPKE